MVISHKKVFGIFKCHSHKPNIIAKGCVGKITDFITFLYEWQKISPSIHTWILRGP